MILRSYQSRFSAQNYVNTQQLQFLKLRLNLLQNEEGFTALIELRLKKIRRATNERASSRAAFPCSLDYIVSQTKKCAGRCAGAPWAIRRH